MAERQQAKGHAAQHHRRIENGDAVEGTTQTRCRLAGRVVGRRSESKHVVGAERSHGESHEHKSERQFSKKL